MQPKRLSSLTASAMDDPLTKDALLVFNKLCQLLQNPDLDRKLDNVYDVRKVLLGRCMPQDKTMVKSHD